MGQQRSTKFEILLETAGDREKPALDKNPADSTRISNVVDLCWAMLSYPMAV